MRDQSQMIQPSYLQNNASVEQNVVVVVFRVPIPDTPLKSHSPTSPTFLLPSRDLLDPRREKHLQSFYDSDQ
jgi:hypothetical protein